MSVDNFVSRTIAGGSEWWAPLDTIVESLVEDTPDLYRGDRPPNTTAFGVEPQPAKPRLPKRAKTVKAKLRRPAKKKKTG